MAFGVSEATSLFHTIVIGASYVLSIYLFSDATKKSRNDSDQILKRFKAVTVACIFAVVYTWLISPDSTFQFFVKLGIHYYPISNLGGIVVGVLIVSILFFGPIVYEMIENSVLEVTNSPPFVRKFDPSFIFKNGSKVFERIVAIFKVHEISNQDLQAIRGYVVGPITEELVFRSCMCYILHIGGFGQTAIIWISSLSFGAAHLHHFIGHVLTAGKSFVAAFINVAVQLTYTTAFGLFTSFVFIRTGSLIATIVMHSYCNFMGLPSLEFARSHPNKTLIWIAHWLGLILFIFSLKPLTTQYIFRSVYYQ